MTKRKDPTRSQRGGKREGSGRKETISGGMKQITVNLPADVLASLQPNPAHKIRVIVENALGAQDS